MAFRFDTSQFMRQRPGIQLENSPLRQGPDFGALLELDANEKKRVRRRALSDSLRGIAFGDQSRHWAQALAQTLAGAMSGYEARQANLSEAADRGRRERVYGDVERGIAEAAATPEPIPYEYEQAGAGNEFVGKRLGLVRSTLGPQAAQGRRQMEYGRQLIAAGDEARGRAMLEEGQRKVNAFNEALGGAYDTGEERGIHATERAEDLTRDDAKTKFSQGMDTQRLALERARVNMEQARMARDEWSSPEPDPSGGGWLIFNKRDPTQIRRIDLQGNISTGQLGGAGGQPAGSGAVPGLPAGPGAALPGAAPGGLPGQIQVTPHSPILGKPTADQNKAGFMGGTATGALGVVQGVIANNPTAAKPGLLETAGTFIGLSPEQQALLVSPERGVVRGAQEGFVDSALTAMTGAAYTEPQLATYRARFMPTIRDTAETTAVKNQAMVDFVRQQALQSGVAWTQDREDQLQQVIAQMNANAAMLRQQAGGQLRTPQPAAPERPAARYLRR